MIPTILVDAPYNMLIGYAFSLITPKALSQRPMLQCPTLWWGTAFNLVFGIGVAFYCYTLAPDWMWMYFIDHRIVSGWMLFYIFAGLYHIFFFFGYGLQRVLASVGTRAKIAGAVAVLAMNGVLLLPLFKRYAVVGTTAEYEAGTAVRWMGVPPSQMPPLGIAMNVGFLVGIPVFAFLVWWIHRKAKNATVTA